jgi:hypothetical protein
LLCSSRCLSLLCSSSVLAPLVVLALLVIGRDHKRCQSRCLSLLCSASPPRLDCVSPLS